MKKSLASLIIALAFVSSAQGAVVVNAVETGGDVVFSYSGAIDQGGWTFLGPTMEPPLLDPTRAYVVVGPTGGVASATFDTPTNLVGPADFGTGGLAFPSSGSGDILGLLVPIRLIVPGGYVRNAPISGTSTYVGLTFASLGMGLGSYTWTWDTPFSASGTDSVTLNVGPLNPVPVPAAIWLFGTALLGFVGMSRRRKVA